MVVNIVCTSFCFVFDASITEINLLVDENGRPQCFNHRYELNRATLTQ